MATPSEHEALYHTLRNSILSRHFAGGRYFRSNLFAQINKLDPTAQPDVARYRLLRRSLENPLLWGANLAVALSVECALGNTEARAALVAMLESTSRLYRFHRGGAFDGYPIRWIPIDPDRWQTDDDGTPLYNREMLFDANCDYLYTLPTTDPRAVPWRAWDTLDALLGEELFAEYRDNFWNFFDLHRRWEVSGDELVGLIGIYAAIHDLSGDASLKAEVAAQIIPLAQYLSANAFMLVRPDGGFTARGPAGMTPAIEAPFRSLLRRVTGTDVGSASFVDALRNAGVWSVLESPVNTFIAETSVAMALGGPVVGPIITGILGSAVGVFAETLKAALGPLADFILGEIGLSIPILAGEYARFVPDPMAVLRAIPIWMHRDVFDVKHDFGDEKEVGDHKKDKHWQSADCAGEFAIASILHGIEMNNRYEAYLKAATFLGRDDPPNGFPPYLGLCAVNDPVDVLAYLNWFEAWQSTARPAVSSDNDDNYVKNIEKGRPWQCFPAAVAAFLGGGESAEQELLSRLDARYTLITETFSNDLRLEDSEDSTSRNENALSAVDYISALALAWMHAQRKASNGTPVSISGFPVPPDSIQTWNTARLPPAAQDATSTARFGFLDGQTMPPEGLEVFGGTTSTQKPPIPKPIVESVDKPLLCDVIVVLPRKHTHDVFSGISLRCGDEWAVDVVRTTGKGLDASGGSDLITDTTYPLHVGLDPDRAIDRALLARLGGWFYVGNGREREVFWYPHDIPVKLYFRLNAPRSKGRGRFLIRVRVWGYRRPIEGPPGSEATQMTRMYTEVSSNGRPKNKRIVSICGGPEDAPWHLSVEQAVSLIEEGYQIMVKGNPPQPLVIVRRTGCVYLRAVGDQVGRNQLLSLPLCTHAEYP